MQNIFIELLPPWIETGLQPAFYDKESGTVLQQVSRMWAKMIELGQGFNTFSTNVTNTVNSYITQFNELYSYVHDYFDNLDVQEEINNKLDEMAESGQLADIISQYLSSTAIFGYDTISDVKNADNLVAGSYAKTIGYLTENDNGGSLYKVRTRTLSDDIDNNKLVAIGNNLVGELVNPSNTATKLGVNLRFDNQSVADIKDSIDTYKYMGVTDIIIVVHLEGENCAVRENVSTVRECISYAIGKNIRVDTVKFHCTDDALKTSESYRTLYKTHCAEFLDSIVETTIDRVIVFNELNSMFNSFASEQQANICIDMVNHFKSLGYEVSITVSSLSNFLDCYYSYPSVTNTFDFIAINDYPIIGDNKNLTSEEEVKEVYENFYNLATKVKSLYPNKDFILSEIGVQNVWESLSKPSNYNIGSMSGVTNSEGKIIPLYFSGLLKDSRLNGIFKEVWLWYTEYYKDYVEEAKIFRDTFVGGNQ